MAAKKRTETHSVGRKPTSGTTETKKIVGYRLANKVKRNIKGNSSHEQNSENKTPVQEACCRNCSSWPDFVDVTKTEKVKTAYCSYICLDTRASGFCSKYGKKR
jgi:hypothetical protein